MRRFSDHRDSVGDKHGAELVGLLVGKDHLDRHSIFLLDDRIVGVGQPPSQLASCDSQCDLFVPSKRYSILANIVDPVAPLGPLEGSRVGGQHGEVGCSRTVNGIGVAAVAFPFFRSELLDACRPLGFVLKLLGVDDQDSGAGCKANPGAIRCQEALGPPVGNIPSSWLEQPRFLKSDRVKDFVVPKDIALGLCRFLFDASDQAECLGGFDVKDPNDLLVCLAPVSSWFEIGSFKGIEDRCGEFAIGGAVNGRRLFAPLDASEEGEHH